MPWRRKWLPTPVFLPGEFQGQRSPVGYSSWSHKESDTTEWLIHTHTHTHTHNIFSVLKLGEWHWNMYNIIYEMSHQPRFNAWYWMLGAGALGWPRGMGWGGMWVGGSGWGTHVHPWLIHVNVWRKPVQYCKVTSLQLKIKTKKLLIFLLKQIITITALKSELVIHSLSCVWLLVTPWTATCGLPCPSPSPGVCSNSCPSSQWCHPAILSSVVPFSSHPQSFPASGSFQISQFFASGDQSIRASASASVLPMDIQDWFL